MPRWDLAGVLLLAVVMAGCGLLENLGVSGRKANVETPAAAEPSESQIAVGHLELLQRLAEATPAEQAEITELARRAQELQPGISNQLRYALVLALPGHAGSDPAAARAALSSLLAAPQRLMPAEQALARLMLADVDARMALLSENERVLAEAGRDAERRNRALSRRVQLQAAENARLLQELEDARAKLEAVADLERSMAERQAAPRGRRP